MYGEHAPLLLHYMLGRIGQFSSSVFDMDITESPGYKDYVWAVELHRLGLKMIGLWPKNDKLAQRSLWSGLQTSIILILLIFACNVPMIFSIAQDWGDMVRVINNLQTTLPFVVVSVKYAIMCWKRAVLLSIIKMMAEDWLAFKLDIERDVMIRRAQTARVIMTIGYVFMIIGLFVVTVPPYFGVQMSHVSNFTYREKQLPLQTYNFYDTDKSPQFELTFLIHVITILSACIVQIFGEIFLILIILHICGQLENFRCRLTRLISSKNFYEALNDIIVRHLRLIRFADNIENTYSLMMLILIFQFGIIFCLCGFLCTIVLNDRKKDGVMQQVFYSVFISTFLLVNTFLYCGAGELIMEQCNAVYQAICDLEWYKLEAKKAKSLILLLARTSQPFHITAGKIIPLTMATFCTVLKTSTGYISILLTKYG